MKLLARITAIVSIALLTPITASAGYTPSDDFDEQCEGLTGFESRMCRRKAQLDYFRAVQKDSRTECHDLRGLDRRACIRSFTKNQKVHRLSRGVRRNRGIRRVYHQTRPRTPTAERSEELNSLRRFGRRRRVTSDRAHLADLIKACRENRSEEPFQDCVRRAKGLR